MHARISHGPQIDITGTEGVLRVTNERAFQNKHDNVIQGMQGDEDDFVPLPVPADYQPLGDTGLDVSQQDVAYLYRAYAEDRANGTAANFADAVRQHEIIDRMFATSAATFS